MSEKKRGRKKMRLMERLLREIDRRGGMTHREMVAYLMRASGFGPYGKSTRAERRRYDKELYGSWDRCGVLENYCTSRDDDTWVLRASITPGQLAGEPMNPVRL